MSLRVCLHCTTAYAADLEACPHCGSIEHRFDWEDDMPRITVAGGPSNADALPGEVGYIAPPVDDAAEMVLANEANELIEQATGVGMFNPSTHDVPSTLLYLDGAGEEEAQRVLDAEAAGKARKGIVDQRAAILARERATRPKVV